MCEAGTISPRTIYNEYEIVTELSLLLAEITDPSRTFVLSKIGTNESSKEKV